LKRFTSYQVAIRAVVLLLVAGQLWANAISYCDWMLDTDLERIELCSSDDSESEKEERQSEKDDKLVASLNSTNQELQQLVITVLHSQDLFPIHYPEITTPPPEFIVVLS
jgi:hypothetical protein